MKIIDRIVAILLTITALAALMAVYKAHFAIGGVTFGTTSGSLSLIAFAINATLWAKAVKEW